MQPLSATVLSMELRDDLTITFVMAPSFWAYPWFSQLTKWLVPAKRFLAGRDVIELQQEALKGDHCDRSTTPST